MFNFFLKYIFTIGICVSASIGMRLRICALVRVWRVRIVTGVGLRWKVVGYITGWLGSSARVRTVSENPWVRASVEPHCFTWYNMFKLMRVGACVYVNVGACGGVCVYVRLCGCVCGGVCVYVRWCLGAYAYMYVVACLGHVGICTLVCVGKCTYWCLGSFMLG